MRILKKSFANLLSKRNYDLARDMPIRENLAINMKIALKPASL